MSFICYVASMKLKESQKLETDGNKLAMLLSFFFCQFQTNICLQNHRNEKWTKACNIQQKVLDILKNWQCQSLGFLCHHPGAVDAPVIWPSPANNLNKRISLLVSYLKALNPTCFLLNEEVELGGMHKCI